MFVGRENFPYVNMSGKVSAAEKSPRARNTTAASRVEGKKLGSRLAVPQPSSRKSWPRSGRKHALHSLPLRLHTEKDTRSIR